MVGNAQTTHVAAVDSGGTHGLEDCRTKSATKGAFLDGQHEARLVDGPHDRFRIERFGEAGVDHTDVESFFPQLPGRLYTAAQEGSEGDKCAVSAPFDDLRATQLDRGDVALDSLDVALGIADRGGRIQAEREVE